MKKNQSGVVVNFPIFLVLICVIVGSVFFLYMIGSLAVQTWSDPAPLLPDFEKISLEKEREKSEHPERTLETPQQIALTTEWSAYLTTPEGKLLNVIKTQGDPAHQKMVNYYFEYHKEICKTVHCDCIALKNYVATRVQDRRASLIASKNSNKVNSNQWNFAKDNFWKTKSNRIYPQGACPVTPPPADGISDRLKRFWPL